MSSANNKSTHMVTRTFSLRSVEALSQQEQEELSRRYTRVFDRHKQVVNLLLELGFELPYEHYRKQSLTSVKSWYDFLRQDDTVVDRLKTFKLKERVYRCAAYIAYFMLRRYKRRNRKIIIISNQLRETWPSFDWEQKRRKKFPSNELLRKVREEYIATYNEWDGINNYHLRNMVSYVRNMVFDQLKSLPVLQHEVRSGKFEVHLMQQLQKKYNHKTLQKLVKSYLQGKSLKLTKSFNQSRRSGYFPSSLIDFGKQLRLDRRDLQEMNQSTWDWHRQLWRDQLHQQLQLLVPHLAVDRLILQVYDNFTIDHYFWSVVIHHKKIRKDLWGSSDQQGFIRYLKSLMKFDLILLVIDYFGAELRSVTNKVLAQLATNTNDYREKGVYDGNGIHIGIDDGQLYQLHNPDSGEKVEVKLSFIPYKKIEYRLNTPERYDKMIADDWQPKRGVVSYKHGKLLLHLPFEKTIDPDINENLRSDRVLGIDLGLKTIATMSLMEDNTEIDRQFLNQKHLVGPKDQWWQKTDETYRLINYKRKLFNLRKEASRRYSQMAKLRNKLDQDYTSNMSYWKVRRRWKWCWRKIKRLHEEMVKQISARIIAYAVAWKVGRIQLEDLAWSKQSKKEQVGYFLNTWQPHWFHSQMQQGIANRAKREGIEVKWINPRNSSKKCSRCGELGSRKLKTFVCNHCGMQLDSDLNAARNITMI